MHENANSYSHQVYLETVLNIDELLKREAEIKKNNN